MSAMKHMWIAGVMCVLAGSPALSAGGSGSERGGPRPSVSIVVDPSVKGLESGVSAAWLGYGIARAKWVGENVLRGQSGSVTYRRSFEEELYGRESLAKIWEELKAKDQGLADKYLDELLAVSNAGFLREYVWLYFWSGAWKTPPDGLRMADFEKWRAENLRGHRPQTFADIRIE